ncbi:unnamed protein product, partial [Closterium sp. NIES-53]
SGCYVESGICVWSARCVVLVSVTLSPDSPLAPPLRTPLSAASTQHALSSPCLWTSQVPAPPPTLACPAVPALRLGVAARCSSLLISSDHFSSADSPHGRADVRSVLIPWICATHHQLHERFRRDLPVLRLHFDMGGEFSSGLLAEFCRDKGIVQPFTLPASPQQNGIAERRIGLMMERPRPHFVGWERLAMRRCFGSGAPSLLSAIPPGASSLLALFAAPSWASPPMPCTHASHPIPLAPLFLVPVPPPVYPPPPQGPAPSAEGVDLAADDTATNRRSPRFETPPGFPPRPSSPPLQPVTVDTGAAWGGDTGGEDAGGADPGGAETGGAETGGAKTGGEGSGGADSGGAASPSDGGAVGAPAAGPGVGQQQPPSRLETPLPQQLCEWVVRRGHSGAGAWSFTAPRAASTGGSGGAGAAGAGGAGANGAGGTGDAGVAGAAGTGGAGAAVTGGATGTRGAGTAGTGGAEAGGSGGAGPGGARTRGPGAANAGGAASAGGAEGATGGAEGATGGAGAAGAEGAGGTAGAGGARAGGTGGAGAAGVRIVKEGND